MKVNRKEAALLESSIQKWEQDALISKEQAITLQNSFEQTKFDWQNLSFYAFVFSIASLLIAGIALLADKWLMEMFEKIVDASEGYKAAFFSITSFLLFYIGQKTRNKPGKIYSHTAFNLLAIMTTAAAIGYFSTLFTDSSGHFSLFILFGAFLYTALGIYFRSHLIWTAGLLTLLIWFGVETSYQSGWDVYFLGMSPILRYVPFCLLLLLLFTFLKRYNFLKPFYQDTISFYLLILLLALWLVSIFGNYARFSDWAGVSQLTMLPWSFAFLITALGNIWAGTKYKGNLIREMGVIAIIANFYSRYVEFGWEILHPALFFAILGFSFWIIGKKAEKIWMIGKN